MPVVSIVIDIIILLVLKLYVYKGLWFTSGPLQSHSSPIMAQEFCRGGGGGCDCEQFTPEPDNSVKCWECGHGKSKHPDFEQAASQSNTAPSNVVPSNMVPSNTASLQVHDSSNPNSILTWLT